jgi:hypothetical protein
MIPWPTSSTTAPESSSRSSRDWPANSAWIRRISGFCQARECVGLLPAVGVQVGQVHGPGLSPDPTASLPPQEDQSPGAPAIDHRELSTSQSGQFVDALRALITATTIEALLLTSRWDAWLEEDDCANAFLPDNSPTATPLG